MFHLSCLTSYDTQIALKNMIINDYTLDAEMIEFCKSAFGNMPDEDLVSGARKLPELLKGRALQSVHDVRGRPLHHRARKVRKVLRLELCQTIFISLGRLGQLVLHFFQTEISIRRLNG